MHEAPEPEDDSERFDAPSLSDDRHVVRTSDAIYLFEERPEGRIKPGGHAVLSNIAGDHIVHVIPVGPMYALRRVDDGKIIKKGGGNPNDVMGLRALEPIDDIEL